MLGVGWCGWSKAWVADWNTNKHRVGIRLLAGDFRRRQASAHGRTCHSGVGTLKGAKKIHVTIRYIWVTNINNRKDYKNQQNDHWKKNVSVFESNPLKRRLLARGGPKKKTSKHKLQVTSWLVSSSIQKKTMCLKSLQLLMSDSRHIAIDPELSRISREIRHLEAGSSTALKF